jgi:hypothetical protein
MEMRGETRTPAESAVVQLVFGTIVTGSYERMWPIRSNDWTGRRSNQFGSSGVCRRCYVISKDPSGVAEMLEVLEDFVDWSKMEVNINKCAIASYLRDMNRHRCSLALNLEFKGQPTPNPTLAQSLKYLGTAVAPRRTVKLESAEARLTEMKI